MRSRVGSVGSGTRDAARRARREDHDAQRIEREAERGEWKAERNDRPTWGGEREASKVARWRRSL